MKQKSRLRLTYLFSVPFVVACGGGGGGGPPPTAGLTGTLRVPEVEPALLEVPPATDELQPMRAAEVVVWLEDGAAPPDLTADGFELVEHGAGPIAVYRPWAAAAKFTLAQGAARGDSREQATVDAAAVLRGKPGIRCAQPNYLLQATVQPNDPLFAAQWHYPQVNLPQAWDLEQGSTSVIVAVLDTGIVSDHPEFTGRLIDGFDMISDAASARDGDGRDPTPEDVGDLATPQGSSFHGTHVAGTIGANGNDGSGVAGVDWNCKIMPVRVLGQGGGSVADIAAGILFAAGLANASGQLPAQRADIVNMSLGGPGISTVLQQACDAAAAAGVLLVAAAGNDNSSTPGSPAAFDSVLSVGAVDLLKARAPYSNFSNTIDIWAPGGDMTADRNGDNFPDGVLSCGADDQGQVFFKFENGTSMASPHVAGIAALLKAANPSLTAAQMRSILLATTQAGSGLPNSGRVVDALAAVQQASGVAATQPLLVATPSSIDFGAAATSLTVVLENRGAGNLVFTNVTATNPPPWLSFLETDATAANGIDFDSFEFQADRTGLPDGVEQVTVDINFLDGATPVSIAVAIRLQVGASTVSTDTAFVLLVDADTLATRFQTDTASGASFGYTFAGVTAGDYVLVAGTDRDNDGLIGDDGELFGAWPGLEQPIVLSLAGGENLSSLDFNLQELATVLAAPAGGRQTYRRLR
ncbi:MAG: S8 family serine peptidase [Planctomycetes bacterium]|nr:S8 family serine peptidase [Planctomycetota bacterium]